MSHCVVYVTVPDETAARRVADALLDARLAACVNIIPGLRSQYVWKGERQDDAELLLLIKTKRERFAELARAVREAHPYEVPEIIALPIVEGDETYLSWIDDNVR